jgi:uncharacterized cupredoxin-like copper-binding protein
MVAAQPGKEMPTMKRAVWLVTVPALLLLAMACGGTAAPKANTEVTVTPSVITGGTVQVAMREFSFAPSSFTVKVGSTVDFVFTNRGAVEHEAVIGDMAFQDEHEKEMAEGGMQMGSGEPEVEAEPGEAKTLTYTFDQPGTLIIGCHVEGHWASGMKATITVVP